MGANVSVNVIQRKILAIFSEQDTLPNYDDASFISQSHTISKITICYNSPI